MDNQPVWAQIIGKITPSKIVHANIATGILPQPTRNFHPPDVVSRGVMPTGLGHQHGIAGLQAVYGSRTVGKCPARWRLSSWRAASTA